MKIIITAGGTSEKIDNVRKITNSSSGKLGLCIANELLRSKGKEIETLYYICNKEAYKPTCDKVKVIEISSTIELKEVIEKLLTNEKIDYFIHSMAVSDYMVSYVSSSSLLSKEIENNNYKDIEYAIINNKNVINCNKISSNEDNLIILLKPTPKVISIIKSISPNTFLVGFKLLDGVSEKKLINVAEKLLNKNKCDLVVANDLKKIRSGNHKAFIIDGNNRKIIANGKEDIAIKLIERMFKNDQIYNKKGK
jgi:phosphopantothenate-cysteine ligase